MPVTLDFRPADPTQEPGASLLQGMRDEIAAVYDGQDLDGPEMPKAGPDELSPGNGGAFLVGYDGETPVCCGALKRLPDGAVEIKRMFVVPEARGRGVARALLAALESEARRMGYEVARLDTGPRQPAALRLYRNSGYAQIGNFNGNPVATFFGEKRL